MARLEDVVGAVISQIGRARGQADAASLEVAAAYRDHPLLAAFPVPRLQLEEVTIDLRMAFATPGAEPRAAVGERMMMARVEGAPETPSVDLPRALSAIVADLPDSDEGCREVADRHPGVRKTWNLKRDEIARKAAEVIPAGRYDPETTARAVASVVKDGFTATLLDKRARTSPDSTREFYAKHATGLESRLVERVRDLLARDAPSIAYPGRPPVSGGSPLGPGGLDVLVTAQELEGIPPERIATVRLVLREADREWLREESPDGQVHARLVPH